MDYFLFAAYLLLFCWLVTKINFFKSTGLDKKVIIALFLFKVIAGCVFGWLYLNYYPNSDTWFFHQEGIKEYELLFSDPGNYFTNLFDNNYSEGLSRVIDSSDSFWNDLRTNLITKILSVFDIFSRCNYYVNTIFFNFITLFGVFAIYKVYLKIFPDKNYLLLLPVFLIPSFILYTSGIHRDGIILLGLGLVLYNIFYAFRVDGFLLRRIIGILGGLLILFLFRNFVLLTLLPSVLAWWICEKNKKHSVALFFLVFTFFILLFFNIGRINPRLDLPRYVSDRQLSFLKYSGNSAMELKPLFPNFRSFMNNAPQALNHSLMRPYLTETESRLELPLALEVIGIELIAVLFLFFRMNNLKPDTFIYFSVFFTLSMFLLIGYTIPFIGALVRYRSVYLPFILTPLICYMDWTSFLGLLRIKN